MSWTPGPPPTGPQLAEIWREYGRHMVWMYGRSYGTSAVFEAERQALYQELETACAMLEAAGDNLEKLRVMLGIISIRAKTLANGHAGRLLRVLVSDARRRGV